MDAESERVMNLVDVGPFTPWEFTGAHHLYLLVYHVSYINSIKLKKW